MNQHQINAQLTQIEVPNANPNPNELMQSRRNFLKFGVMTAAGIILAGLPDIAIANQDDFWFKDRVLTLKRQDNKESATICFFKNGRYDPDAYHHACWVLRDAKDGNQMASMDTGLLNLLYANQQWAREAGIPNPEIIVNSAYRTARRNAHIEGAAKNSLHTKGQAVDITMKGINLGQLNRMVDYFQVGGVGVYDTFLHVDTGRVRRWKG